MSHKSGNLLVFESEGEEGEPEESSVQSFEEPDELQVTELWQCGCFSLLNTHCVTAAWLKGRVSKVNKVTAFACTCENLHKTGSDLHPECHYCHKLIF